MEYQEGLNGRRYVCDPFSVFGFHGTEAYESVTGIDDLFSGEAIEMV